MTKKELFSFDLLQEPGNHVLGIQQLLCNGASFLFLDDVKLCGVLKVIINAHAILIVPEGPDKDQIQAFQLTVNAFFVRCNDQKVNGLSIPRVRLTRVSKEKREGKLIRFLYSPGSSEKSNRVDYCKKLTEKQSVFVHW